MRHVYVGAPLLVAAYGIVRLIDGLDGSKGPGPAWTIGHLFFLAALALFAVAMVGLWRRRRTWLATAALVGGVIGVVAMARVVVVDIIVAWGAADRAGMEREYARYDDFPGLPDGFGDVLDEAGGVLFPLGLVVLMVGLAAARRLPWWSPVLAVGGFATILVTLDLLPLAGALLLGAFLPARGTSRSPVAAPLP
jgi:MYXO-CTERM domain-containing protein